MRIAYQRTNGEDPILVKRIIHRLFRSRETSVGWQCGGKVQLLLAARCGALNMRFLAGSVHDNSSCISHAKTFVVSSQTFGGRSRWPRLQRRNGEHLLESSIIAGSRGYVASWSLIPNGLNPECSQNLKQDSSLLPKNGFHQNCT